MTGSFPGPAPGRPEPAPGDRRRGSLSNVGIVARREYGERVGSRAFVLSTLLLAGLAVVIALIPLAVRLVDRVTVTRVAVVAPDPALSATAVSVLDTFLNGGPAGAGGQFLFEPQADAAAAAERVRSGAAAAAVIIDRRPDGGLAFEVLSEGALAPDRAQLLQIGAFGVGVLDWTSRQPPGGGAFVMPSFDLAETGGGVAGAPGLDPAEYANRRVVGIVFVVLSFLTLVFYGLWVASGVVAEKANRVMELLISAATAPELVTGKMLGIGLAGLTQVTLVLVPALVTLVASGEIGNAVLGSPAAGGSALAGLSPGLLLAFLVYFVLGFALYAALYAGAGSMLSRAEDLQVVALPLSIPAIAGYLPAVLALSGGSSGFIRFASYMPAWSPFVMLSRLSVGRVEPWELALSIGLLLVTVPLVTLLAIRVYRAGVVMYGQPPTPAAFARAIRGR